MNYVAIEGGEYVGKSSLIENLTHHLPNAVLVREPGGTPAGEKLRTLLRHEINCPIAAMFGFAAQRALICSEVLKDLDESATVISDRCYLTSVVYQSLIGGIDKGKIIALHEDFLPYLPNKIIYLTASNEAINERKLERGEEVDILGTFADSQRDLVNGEYLLTLHQLKEQQAGFDYIVIDTSNLTPKQIAVQALAFINN